MEASNAISAIRSSQTQSKWCPNEFGIFQVRKNYWLNDFFRKHSILCVNFCSFFLRRVVCRFFVFFIHFGALGKGLLLFSREDAAAIAVGSATIYRYIHISSMSMVCSLYPGGTTVLFHCVWVYLVVSSSTNLALPSRAPSRFRFRKLDVRRAAKVVRLPVRVIGTQSLTRESESFWSTESLG